jgi:hypothetical protein
MGKLDLKNNVLSFHRNDSGRLYVYVNNELFETFEEVYSDGQELEIIQREIIDKWAQSYDN